MNGRTKTVFGIGGIGALLLLLRRGSGFGLGKGEGDIAEPMPPMLVKLLQVGNHLPIDTVQLVVVQRSKTFTGGTGPDDFIFAKTPSDGGEAVSLSELVSLSDWFKSGKLKLAVSFRGDLLNGNVELVKTKLAEAGLPVTYQEKL